MSYTFLLSDLATGRTVSELAGAGGKSVSVPVCSMGTSSVSARVDTPDADLLLEGDKLLRAYEVNDNYLVDGDRTLLAHHRLITAEEDVADDQATVSATFADPYWTLLRRLIGKSATGYVQGTPSAPVDRATIIGACLAATNAEGPSGVRLGATAPSSSTYVSGWYYKPVAEVVAELGATLDGPDWRVRPIEQTVDGYYGELDILPSISSLAGNAVFEHGEGLRNVQSYKRTLTYETTATRAFTLPPGFPDNATQAVLMAEDTAAQAQRGLLEVLVTSDLNVDDLRAKLLAYHIAARGGARQTITFDPVRDTRPGRVPKYGVDYTVGDVLPFRATIQRRQPINPATDPGGPSMMVDVPRINVLARVYTYSVTVDDVGNGVPTLSVVPTGT